MNYKNHYDGLLTVHEEFEKWLKAEVEGLADYIILYDRQDIRRDTLQETMSKWQECKRTIYHDD